MSLLFVLKGGGERAFYRWLERDYRPLFPLSWLPPSSVRPTVVMTTRITLDLEANVDVTDSTYWAGALTHANSFTMLSGPITASTKRRVAQPTGYCVAGASTKTRVALIRLISRRTQDAALGRPAHHNEVAVSASP